MAQMMHSDNAAEYSWTTSAKDKAKTKTGIATALRRNEVEVETKFQGSGPRNAKKLDEDSGNYKHREVSHDFKIALMQARMAKKMTQKDLAQAIQQPPAVIQTYENGKAIPDGQVIMKLNRVLGVKLPQIKAGKKKHDEN